MNVYILGHTFLRLCQLLSLQLPVVDPALFIRRFAAKIQMIYNDIYPSLSTSNENSIEKDTQTQIYFPIPNDKIDLISSTSLRIVSQMKRDWLTEGIDLIYIDIKRKE
jgi:hypothetical protein